MRAAARASERYDKMVFLFSGDGEQRDELIDLAADLGISDKVFFTGFVRGKQWRDAFHVSDVFVMSSVSEPFGLTALEAAHFNNALIITKQSGVGEVLKGIFRYDFWDVDRLADQLVGIATSPALLSSLRQAAKSEYLKLSWHDVADKCVRNYRLLATRSKYMSRGITLYLHVHQPWRVREYSVFDTALHHDYYDGVGENDRNNARILNKVADKSYRPMNALLKRLLDRHPEFKVSLSITGTFIEQARAWAPDVLDDFRELVATGRVEIVAETYYHSLAFFYSREEFEKQVDSAP